MAGDPRTIIAEWVDQYGRLLFAYAFRWTNSRADAEDIVQSVFVRSVAHFSKIVAAESIRAYLLTMTRHEAIRMLKGKTRATDPWIDEREDSGELLDASDVAEALERSDWVTQALRLLSDTHRNILLMYYFEEMGYKEIAEHLDMPIGTVMSRLSRAKESLKETLTAISSPSTLEGNNTR